MICMVINLSRFRTIEDIVHNQANIYDFTEI